MQNVMAPAEPTERPAQTRELTERFGKPYQDYKKRVPFLIPSLRRKSDEGSRD